MASALGLALILWASVPALPPGADVTRLKISAPQTTRTLDAGTFRGTPTRLCPSPDGTQVYVRTSQLDRWANETIWHHLVTIRGEGATPVDGEPAWALLYWMWKSGREAPGRPGFRIDLESRWELLRTTNVPREGSIGASLADPNETLNETVGRAALANQKILVETLTLNGRTILKQLNQHVVPGRTFGWSPVSLGLIAYVNDKGRLVLMDEAGRTREIAGTHDATLPAWSDDGGTLFFLQRAGRNAFELRQVEVRPAQG